jgi:DNA-directed RNA polymerase specialized sigma24 family protein
VAPVDTDRLEHDERYRIARIALDRLGDDCRELIRLLTIDQMTYRDIERSMGWADGGTAIRRSRCLDKVRKTPEVSRYLRDLHTIEESRELS